MLTDESQILGSESKCLVIVGDVNPLTARHFFFMLSFGAGQIFSFLIPGAG